MFRRNISSSFQNQTAFLGEAHAHRFTFEILRRNEIFRLIRPRVKKKQQQKKQGKWKGRKSVNVSLWLQLVDASLVDAATQLCFPEAICQCLMCVWALSHWLAPSAKQWLFFSAFQWGRHGNRPAVAAVTQPTEKPTALCVCVCVCLLERQTTVATPGLVHALNAGKLKVLHIMVFSMMWHFPPHLSLLECHRGKWFHSTMEVRRTPNTLYYCCGVIQVSGRYSRPKTEIQGQWIIQNVHYWLFASG